MKAKELDYVRDTIENEGSLEYAFIHYSEFEEIEDPEFHKLRQDFVDAHRALCIYLAIKV